MKVFDRTKGASWGKLGICARLAAVALVAMAFTMVGCAKHVGGGEPPVPTPKKTQGEPVAYRFESESGDEVAAVSLAGIVPFGTIKASSQKIESYEIENNILGWIVKGETGFVDSAEKFYSETTFVGIAQSSSRTEIATYKFINNGQEIGSYTFTGEIQFSVIKSKCMPNWVDPDRFLGWEIEGENIFAGENEVFASSKTFVAKYKEADKFKASIDKYDVIDIVWMNAKTGDYTVFTENDSGEPIMFTVSSEKTVNDVKKLKNQYTIKSSLLAATIEAYKSQHPDSQFTYDDKSSAWKENMRPLKNQKDEFDKFVSDNGLSINENVVWGIYADMVEDEDFAYLGENKRNAFGDLYACDDMPDFGPFWLNPEATAILDKDGNILYVKK